MDSSFTPLPSPPSMTAGGSLKCQVMENSKCGFPMERRAGGQNKSLGQASHSCCKDGRSRGEAEIAIHVSVICPLAGAGSWPCMASISRYGPMSTPEPMHSKQLCWLSGSKGKTQEERGDVEGVHLVSGHLAQLCKTPFSF